jgi:carbon-monoxide dehydrogenase medium subunit
VKPPPVGYARPQTLGEALDLLAGDPDAVALAGGQSLIPLLNLRLSRPSTLVDVTRIDALTGIVQTPDGLLIGAATRQLDVERSAVVAERCPALRTAVGLIGHSQIRSRGTIGGSVAHADPSAELCTLSVALGATVVVAARTSTREIAAADFFLGPYTTALEPGEVVTGVRVPYHRPTSAFVEFSRRDGDFALMSVGAVASFEDGKAVSVQIAVGGGDLAAPLRLTDVESDLVGSPLADDDVARAAADGADEVVRGGGGDDAGFRRRLARALICDALEEVSGGRFG